MMAADYRAQAIAADRDALRAPNKTAARELRRVAASYRLRALMVTYSIPT